VSRPEQNYELRDFSARWAFFSAAALIAIISLLGIFLLRYQRHVVKELPPAPIFTIPAASPGGEAEFESGETRHALETADSTILATYGWVNRSQLRAHIPIRRAMEIAAKRRAAGK
jgi:hypothetical protein